MEQRKFKEPLLALMLSFFVTGLGQIYVGKVNRGVVLFLFNLLGFYLVTNILLNPSIRTHPYMLGLLLMMLILSVYNLIDAYLGAKKYNQTNNVHHDVGFGRRVLLIVGILFSVYVNFNSLLVGFSGLKDIKSFKISDDSMNPILAKGDRIITKSYQHTAPQRGDIVVFEYPGPKHRTSIKRLVALPNEVVEMKPDGVYVDNNKINYPELNGVDFYNQKGYNGGEPVRKFTILDNSYYLLDKKMGAEMPLNLLLYKTVKIYYPQDRAGEVK